MTPKAHLVYELVQVRKPQKVASVIDAACEEYGTNRDALLSGKRTRPYQQARRAICRKLRAGGRTFPVIARLLNVHHSTVQYYLRDEEESTMPIALNQREDEQPSKACQQEEK